MFNGPFLPWAILASLLLAGIAGASGFKYGRAWEERKYLKERAIAAEVEARAEAGAAKAIAQIEIKHQTIRTQAETIVREVPIYKDPKCVHPPDMLRLLNDALENKPTGPIDTGFVPPVGSLVRSEFLFDNPQVAGSNQAVLPVSGSGHSNEQ